MTYRCPHCGEPGFPLFKKAIIIRYKYSYDDPKCNNCRKEAELQTRRGGRRGWRWGEFALWLVLLPVWGWMALHLPERPQNGPELLVNISGVVVPILVIWFLVMVFRCLFCHLDKPEREGYTSADKFRFTTDGAVRLWPRVRVGEIYLIRFPKRKKKEDGPYLIGMVTKVEKNGDRREITVRVVKEYLMEAPLLEEELVLTTEKGFSLSGVVSHTYRLPSEEE